MAMIDRVKQQTLISTTIPGTLMSEHVSENQIYKECHCDEIQFCSISQDYIYFYATF